MDSQSLLSGLRDVKARIYEYEWKLCFYTSKKTKDGIDMQVSQCAMKNIAGLMDSTVVNLLEKVLPDRAVVDYTPFLPKEAIAAVDQSDVLIHEQLVCLLTDVKNAYPFSAEDFVMGVAPTPTGFLFEGLIKNEKNEIVERVLLMKRSNPFIKGTKRRLCVTVGGEIAEAETPLFDFPHTADLLLIGDTCYILSPNVEKDLGLESRQAAITGKRLQAVAECSIVSNFEELEKAAYKSTRKFLTFDREVLDFIVRLPLEERADFLSRYGLCSDSQGLVDTADAEQCDFLIDLLCGRSCHDALGRLSVGSNIMPR